MAPKSAQVETPAAVKIFFKSGIYSRIIIDKNGKKVTMLQRYSLAEFQKFLEAVDEMLPPPSPKTPTNYQD
jgi:hypothetical protein